MKHIKEIKKALGIANVQTSHCQWPLEGSKDSKGTQVDLLLDRKDQCINLFEIKYYNDEVTISKAMAENIRYKKSTFIEENNIQKAIFVTLLSVYGVRKNEYSDELIDAIVIGDDLF